MQANAVLGVDISKQKFDAHLLEGNKEQHKIFCNNKEGFEKLVVWCNHHGADLVHLCLEATGCYSEDLVTFMYDPGHNVSVVNAKGKVQLLWDVADISIAALLFINNFAIIKLTYQDPEVFTMSSRYLKLDISAKLPSDTKSQW